MTKKYAPHSQLSEAVGNPMLWEPSLVSLRYVIVAILVGAVTFTIVVRFITPDQPGRMVGPLLIALVAVSAWHLLSRGRTQAAVKLLAIGVWMATTGISVFYGGVRTPVIAAYPIIILMFGWLVSRHATLVVAALSIAVIIGFVVLDALGLLPYAPSRPPVLYGVVQVTLVVLATLLTIARVRAYQDRLTELGQIGSNLARRTRELETSQAELNRAQAVAKVGSWVYDIVTDTMRLSAETCRIFNLPEGTTGSHDTHLTRAHAQDRDAVERAWQAALKGDLFDQEHRIMAGKAIRWIRQKAELEFAADGTALRAVGITQDITERKHAQTAMLNLHRDLHESRQRLRDRATQNEAAREEERKHIAREVHDELGQVLSALRMSLLLMEIRFASLDPALNSKVLDMKALVDRALQGARNVALNLRPPALDMGLAPAIKWLCFEFTRHTTIACELHALKEIGDLNETRFVSVFRIVQESLTNITRYADATQVDITLGRRDNDLSLRIQDNGRGFDLAQVDSGKTFGLLGMRERAMALGGRVEIASTPGQGTVINVTIPINVDTPKDAP